MGRIVHAISAHWLIQVYQTPVGQIFGPWAKQQVGLPELFGQSILSGWAIIGSAVGGLVGIWAGYQLGKDL